MKVLTKAEPAIARRTRFLKGVIRAIKVRNAVKAVNAVKKNNSPHFTAFLTKIHRICFPTFTQSDLN